LSAWRCDRPELAAHQSQHNQQADQKLIHNSPQK
jgi:hypothetical protein